MLHKLKTRLRNRSGFSLAEVLIVVLILALVTAIAAEGIPTALRAYDRAVTAANAQALMNTAMTKLRNELGTASDVTVDGTTVSYTVADGSHSQLRLTDGTDGIMLQEYIGLSEDSQYTHRLVSQAASNQNLYVKYDSVEGDLKGVVTFTNLAVYRVDESDAPLASIPSYQIRVLADAEA